MIQKTYQELMNATFYSMVVFVIIAIIGTCSIIATGSYSLFIAKKKDSAILSCLGARRRDVIKIFVDYTVAIVIGAALVSLPISLYLERTANNLLYQYFMFKNLIAIPYASFLKTPFLLLFILIASSLVVSCGCTILPILVYKKFSLAEELRDE
jgi:ABC-type antimicrobial peptide transport system permease subunit